MACAAASCSRLVCEIGILRRALAESEAQVLESEQSRLGKRPRIEEPPLTQGIAARPRTLPADEIELTQGVAAPPRSVLADEPSDDEAEPCTQAGVAAAPRSLLMPLRASAQNVHVAFTGLKPGAELQRLHSIVTRLGGTLEGVRTLSQSVTHVVVSPAVGARTTPMSVCAALTKKVLVSPAWLHASDARGAFIALGPAPPTPICALDAPTVGGQPPMTPHVPPAADCDGAVGAVDASEERMLDDDATPAEHGLDDEAADIRRVGLAVRGVANPLECASCSVWTRCRLADSAARHAPALRRRVCVRYVRTQ
jgi:hypothetical protein